MWLAKIGKKYKRITSDEAVDTLAGLESTYRPTDIFMIAVLGELADTSQIGNAANDANYAKMYVYSLGDILDMRYLDTIDGHPSQNMNSWGTHPVKRTLINSAYHWQYCGDFTIIGFHGINGLLPFRRFTAKEMRRNGLLLSQEDWFWLTMVLGLSHPLPEKEAIEPEHGNDTGCDNNAIIDDKTLELKDIVEIRKKKSKVIKSKRLRQRERDRKFGITEQFSSEY